MNTYLNTRTVDIVRNNKNMYNTCNILIVSNSNNTVSKLKGILKTRGHKVDICSEYFKSITMCMKGQYDVLFVDISENNCISFVQILKKLECDFGMYIFILTSKEINKKLLKSLSNNIFCIQKPIKKEIINRLLKYTENHVKL